MSQPTSTGSFVTPQKDSAFATPQEEKQEQNNEADDKINNPVMDDEPDTFDGADNDVKEENSVDTSDQESATSDSVGSSAFAHGMLMSSGVPSGKKDEGNHEDREDVKPLEINDEGYLVDGDGNKIFTTNEEAIKDGSMLLDAKGRQPGVYLDDLEDLQRRQYAKAVEVALDAAESGRNSPVERQVNVRNSGIPPVTVTSTLENPDSGERQSDDAKVPELKHDPLPAE